MLMWQAVLGLLAGGLILIVSSEKAVDQLINLAKILGLNIFTIGFIVASIGSDLPEIMNSLISSSLSLTQCACQTSSPTQPTASAAHHAFIIPCGSPYAGVA